MDSVTQIALGAAVGEATLGRKVGNRAMLWGALCGTLPDLDVFIPLGDAVRDFTYHRSVTHSLLVLAALTPLLVWLILKLHPQTRPQRWGWAALVYLVFATHALLDSFTVYGTQLLWPLDTTPVSWSTIFIIDPLYTLPLLLGVVAALRLTRDTLRGHRLNHLGLALSSLYLAWTVGAKWQVENITRASLTEQGIGYERLLSTPAPLNSLLWRLVAMDGDGYYEGYYSLLDRRPQVRMVHYPSQTELLNGIEDYWPVRRLQWFTHGFYSVTREGAAIVITDLRMGLEGDYIFRFKVAELGNPHPVPVTPATLPGPRDFGRLRWVWERIWGEAH